jgi:hypothetical protein
MDQATRGIQDKGQFTGEHDTIAAAQHFDSKKGRAPLRPQCSTNTVHIRPFPHSDVARSSSTAPRARNHALERLQAPTLIGPDRTPPSACPCGKRDKERADYLIGSRMLRYRKQGRICESGDFCEGTQGAEGSQQSLLPSRGLSGWGRYCKGH